MFEVCERCVERMEEEKYTIKGKKNRKQLVKIGVIQSKEERKLSVSTSVRYSAAHYVP